ncbi:hypothetical protein NDU88_003634 [Pleurodeles waltl]|uniref:Uncharacterized protein n=1 Tax=Pleurodeles waltl TaxID=8319 RepID=A0AAV7KW02_PLEWA|nr:hypothetical protein NDU88_003634 [Pleurodeles waltl]
MLPVPHNRDSASSTKPLSVILRKEKLSLGSTNATCDKTRWYLNLKNKDDMMTNALIILSSDLLSQFVHLFLLHQ